MKWRAVRTSVSAPSGAADARRPRRGRAGPRWRRRRPPPTRAGSAGAPRRPAPPRPPRGHDAPSASLLLPRAYERAPRRPGSACLGFDPGSALAERADPPKLNPARSSEHEVIDDLDAEETAGL